MRIRDAREQITTERLDKHGSQIRWKRNSAANNKMTDASRRKFSSSSVRALHTPEDPPNHKDVLYSWVVCFAACLVQVVTFGILNSFGVIFVELREEFKVSKAELSWIASLAFGMSLGLGPLAGAFRLRFGTRVAICCGGISCATSLLVSSFVPNTKALFGTYSLLYAIGGGLIVNSTTILAPDYFERYVAVATGIVVSGGSLGTLLFSFLTELCVKSVGWRRTFRIYSGISLLTIFLGLLIRPVRKPLLRHSAATVNPPHEVQANTSLKLWENRAYVVWVLAVTCGIFGYFIPYVHLISYGVDIGLSKESGSILIMIIGGTSALGRLLFGKVLSFQFLNKRQIYQLSMMVTATSTMMLPISTSMGALVVYAVVQGVADGCNVVLVPLLTRIYAGDTQVPMAWGILNGISSITFTLGPPVAGWMSDATGSYNVSFHIAGIPMIAAAAILFFIPWAQHTTYKRNPITRHPAAVASQNHGDTSAPIEPGQVLVGLPVVDTMAHADERDFVSRDSRVLNTLPTESEILNESRWSWSSIHRTSSIEIPAPKEENSLHKTVSSRGIETLSASEDSDSGFVIVDKDEMMDSQAQSPDRPNMSGEELQKVKSPVVIDYSVVDTLVELNEDSENQGKFEDLVQLNESLVTTSLEHDEEKVPLSEESGDKEDNAGANVVIPSYVVEKLRELNENEQKKTSSEAVVDTLVDFTDDENDIDELIVGSGVNRIEESEMSTCTENKVDQRYPRNAAFSRQSSDSQCIISQSVVETLENLVQTSQSGIFTESTDKEITFRDTHIDSPSLDTNSPFWQPDAPTNAQISTNFSSTQTNAWQPPINSENQWNAGFVRSETIINDPSQLVTNDKPFNTHMPDNLNNIPADTWNTSDNVTIGNNNDQWKTGFTQSPTAVPYQYPISTSYNSVQTNTWQSSNNTNDGPVETQWTTECVQSETTATDHTVHTRNSADLNSVQTDPWQSSNNTSCDNGWVQCNPSFVQSQTEVNDQSPSPANLNSTQINAWTTCNNGKTDLNGIQWNTSTQQLTDQSTCSTSFNTVPTDGWQQSTGKVGNQINTQTHVQTNGWHLSNNANVGQWNETSVQSQTTTKDPYFNRHTDRASNSTAEWIGDTTQRFLNSYPESTVDSPQSLTAVKGFSPGNIFHQPHTQITSDITSATVFDTSTVHKNEINATQPTQSGSALPTNGFKDWWTDKSHTGQTSSSNQSEQHKSVTWCDPVSNISDPQTSGSAPNSRQNSDSSPPNPTAESCSNPFTEDNSSQPPVDNDTLATFDQLWVKSQSPDPNTEEGHKGE